MSTETVGSEKSGPGSGRPTICPPGGVVAPTESGTKGVPRAVVAIWSERVVDPGGGGSDGPTLDLERLRTYGKIYRRDLREDRSLPGFPSGRFVSEEQTPPYLLERRQTTQWMTPVSLLKEFLCHRTSKLSAHPQSFLYSSLPPMPVSSFVYGSVVSFHLKLLKNFYNDS